MRTSRDSAPLDHGTARDDGVWLIHVPMAVMGKARAGHGRGGHSYTTKPTADAMRAIEASARAQLPGLCADPLTGGVRLSVVVFSLRPTTMKPRPLPSVKPDFDNIAKTICDALNGVVWRDDCQVTDGRVIKRYGVTARTAILIEHDNGETPAWATQQ